MKTRVIIIGAGGHGREVADIVASQARQGQPVEPLGFIDENPHLKGSVIDGLPVLGGWEWFQGVDRREIAVIAAFGNPPVMKRVTEKAESLGLALGQAISPLAFVSPHAVLEPGAILFPHTFVSTQTVIRKAAAVSVAGTVSHHSEVGSFTLICPGAHVGGGVRIGEGVWLGIGASVIHGVTIGAWTMVGGGAAVVCDIPDRVTAVGVPARVIKRHAETGPPF